MSINYKEVSQRISKKEAAIYAKGIQIMSDVADSLQRLGELPERFLKPEVTTEAAPITKQEAPEEPRGLEQIRYVIEIPEVSEELYARTREALEAVGYTFVAAIRSVSIEDLLLEDKQREREGKPRRLGYVNDSKTMRATVTPELEVAINPSSVRIEGSNRLSTNDQQARIREEEVRWKKQLPEDVRPFVSMRMVDPSTLVQLDEAFQEREGKLVFPDYFARTDVQTVRGSVAGVGRSAPADRLDVSWLACWPGLDVVFAVSVVVLPRKLVA